MHKLESFALSCGSKISKPHAEIQYFPITDEKFICFSREHNEQSKVYDYFDDVIYHIKPFLDKKNIKLYEISSGNQPPLFYTKNLTQLNQAQRNYVIKQSLMYVGNSNLLAHVACFFNKKTLCPFNNDYVNLIKPYWSSDDNFYPFTPDIKAKPSLSHEENPKTINLIKPEILSQKILNLLGIDHDLNKIETVFSGSAYFNQTIEAIPGNYSIAHLNLDQLVNVRMDKNFDLSFLDQCSVFQKINIVTDRHIDLEIIKKLKDKIHKITYFVNLKTSENDIKNVQSLGVDLQLVTKNSKKINEIRFKFLDFYVLEYYQYAKKDLDFSIEDDLHFLSKRKIIHNSKIFNSFLSVELNRNTTKVENIDKFLDDLPFCRVFKKTS